ncbi:NmrA family NAD(P)-binding protein [Enterococcus sp. 669A]|uniref:NmrA family NAD(P)-binding protein n=1 Tax=Candidatus Enterococcus moelleringii TaxID=2815325 RepID=A0ABS3LG88_9ENTE|nr:NmrA family NAD(P)-binding protein [Enterococcus sp. 669A]MBO1307711.1 NmrA family NAD(P)-binding protein [Enterococcus sp. 669A]
MILVTAAAGGVGRQMVTQLVKHGLDIRAFDINPKVEELKELGVAETIVGDGRSVDDVKKALDGCDKVLYIPPMFIYDEAEIAKRFVNEAVNAGIQQFVMMTVTHPNMSTLPQHTQKLKAEEQLVYKGLSDHLNYTILQPMHYMHNFSVPMVWSTNAYQCFYTKTTKLSYVDVVDVAEVAAKVLTETTHANATYELVGTDFLSPDDMVEKFNQLTGREAVCQQIPVETIINYFPTAKYDSYFVKTFQELSKTYGDYGIAGNANVLTWLLGRQPTTFDEYIKREIAANQLS